MSLAQPAYQDTAEMMRYRRTALSTASLRKVLTGKADLLNAAGILRRSAQRHLRYAARNIGRRIGVTLQDDLVTELRTIRAHHISVHFVFATTDPGYSMLRQQAGSEFRHLLRTGAVTVDFIDHSDHTFTPRVAQQGLLSLLARIFVMSSRRVS